MEIPLQWCLTQGSPIHPSYFSNHIFKVHIYNAEMQQVCENKENYKVEIIIFYELQHQRSQMTMVRFCYI